MHDPESGAHWYYHSHGRYHSKGRAPAANACINQAATPQTAGDAEEHGAMPGEHGHFHCFVCPEGKGGPIHHLVGISVNNLGQLQGFFTVGQHVVDDVEISAEDRIALIERFDVQLARPDYLVNRWLTALVALFQEEIAGLIREGSSQAQLDPSLDVTASLETTLAEKLQRLSGA